MKCHGMIICICRSDHTVLLQVNKSECQQAKNKIIIIIAATIVEHGLQECCYAECFHLLPSEQAKENICSKWNGSPQNAV